MTTREGTVAPKRFLTQAKKKKKYIISCGIYRIGTITFYTSPEKSPGDHFGLKNDSKQC